MTEERKKEIESLAKDIFMLGVEDLFSNDSGVEVVVEYSAGCTIFAKKFYEGFDESLDK